MTDEPEKDSPSPIESLVRAAAPTSFDAGFGDRVLSRLHAAREHSFSNALNRQFRLVVPLAAAVAQQDERGHASDVTAPLMG